MIGPTFKKYSMVKSSDSNLLETNLLLQTDSIYISNITSVYHLLLRIGIQPFASRTSVYHYTFYTISIVMSLPLQ